MPFQYITVKGDVYHLTQSFNARGTRLYHLVKNKKGPYLDAMPEGYEIFEDPNGTVTLRKDGPKLISDEELQLVIDGMQRYSAQPKFLCDRHKKTITIYTCFEMDAAFLAKRLKLGPVETLLLESRYREFQPFYDPEMCFALVHSKERLFSPQRLFINSRLHGMRTIGDSDTLENLIPRYLRILTKHSAIEART
ncbi:MAG: hypothetical protein M5R41_15430 [Bacteroidia bacterium]|nr:hypothetical protein [Bacteroidia bacterium]